MGFYASREKYLIFSKLQIPVRLTKYKMTIRGLGIVSILICTVASFLISISGDTEGAGLGGLFNVILPPFVGAISLIIYLLVCWISKETIPRVITIIGCCLYLFYIGFNFLFNPGNLPIPF